MKFVLHTEGACRFEFLNKAKSVSQVSCLISHIIIGPPRNQITQFSLYIYKLSKQDINVNSSTKLQGMRSEHQLPLCTNASQIFHLYWYH